MEVSNSQKKRERLELRSTIMLAIATTAITWCTYQSNLWTGIELFKLAESNRNSRLAQQETILAAQQQQLNAEVAINFMNAALHNDQKVIDYYLNRGKSDLVKVMSEWLAMDPLNNKSAPPHPLAMPGYNKLRISLVAKSDSFTRQSSAIWEEAEYANKNGDSYVLLTVILSLVLFIGAVATKMVNLRLAYLLVNFSGLICLGILIILIFFMPVTRGN